MDTTSVTRTLSRIPNIFLDAARSTTDCNAREHQQVFEDPSSHDQETDPTVETPRLPEDHPVYLLEEARTFYQGQEPTFALRRHRENVPTVILAATSSTPCKRAKLVAKLWDAKTMFWTLDLNNVRYIVKCFRGGPLGGSKYLYWAGPTKGFEQVPIAFSDTASRSSHDVALLSDGESSQQIEKRYGQPKRARAPLSQLSANNAGTIMKREDEDMSAFAQRLLDLSASSTSPDSEGNARATESGKASKARNALKKGKRPTRQSDLPPRLGRLSDDTSTSQTASSKRRKTDIHIREVNYLWEQSTSSPLQRRIGDKSIDASDSSVSFDPRTDDAAPPDQGVGARTSNSPVERCTSEAAQQNQPYTSSKASLRQRLVHAVSLPEHKQKRTTLIVRVLPEAEYQPLKLTASPNIESLYAQVLGAWNVVESEVAKVTVTFVWMNPEDRMRVMVLNRHQEASFLYLLEQIEDSPCWEEDKRKCLLDVDILLK